ncbi:MAG: hypothetical protein PHY72_01485 [Candidatus Pacebacteria bacterium]|nr:hypothetical protein [Candidatus Paceibacterota bacterium]
MAQGKKSFFEEMIEITEDGLQDVQNANANAGVIMAFDGDIHLDNMAVSMMGRYQIPVEEMAMFIVAMGVKIFQEAKREVSITVVMETPKIEQKVE